MIEGIDIINAFALLSNFVFVPAISYGSQLALGALGITLIFGILRFANFAHAELFIVGAYVGVAWSEIYSERSPILQDYFGALLVAFLLAGIVALLSDLLVFQPIRQLNASNESLMISSIGVGLIIRNIVSMFYGGKAVYFRLPSSQEIPRIDIPSVLFGSISGVTPLNIKGTNFALRYEILLALTVSLREAYDIALISRYFCIFSLFITESPCLTTSSKLSPSYSLNI